MFLLNAVLLILSITLFKDIVSLMLKNRIVIPVIDELTDNVATVMVAFGVLIEEREEILRLLGVRIDTATSRSHEMALKYGIYFIVVGLFIEVFVEAMKIPLRFFQNGALHTLLAGGSVVLALTGVVAGAGFAYELLFDVRQRKARYRKR